MGGATVSGDGTLNTATGALTVTKTSGTAFSALATASSVNLATQVSGNLAVSHLNSGTGASSSSYWRGDGTWAVPGGGGNVVNSGTPTSGQVAVWTNATTIQGVTVTGTGAPVLATSPALTTPTVTTAAAGTNTTQAASTAFVLANHAPGFRNRIINATCLIDQRNSGAAQTIVAGADVAYTVDRFYAFCTGVNVMGQQVFTPAIDDGYQFSGTSLVSAIGFGQRIESFNCFDLAGSTVTLSAFISNSLLTTVTWSAYYATTTDSWGTLASPTRTLIATGTFTVSSTVSRYNAQISVPSAATTGIAIEFTVGSQTSGTWLVAGIQLETGSAPTPLERRPIGIELGLCLRYYYQLTYSIQANTYAAGSAQGLLTYYSFPVPMRISPAVSGVVGFLTNATGSVSTFPDRFAINLSSTAAGQCVGTFPSGSSFNAEL